MTTTTQSRWLWRVVLWIWLAAIGFLTLPTFGYDGQVQSQTGTKVAYDDGSLTTAEYGGVAVSSAQEHANDLAGTRTSFAVFTNFLAAEGLPQLEISASKYPDLAENILNAQQTGNPSLPTAGGDIAANRAAALEGVPNIPGLSRDEYPFASSMEGGQGAWVGHIPVSQQNAQGALIKNFINANNITPGMQYKVVIVP